MTDLAARIESLSDDQVMEVAVGALAYRIGIDDPATAADQVVRALARSPDDAPALAEAAREAVSSDPAKVAEMLRLALEHAADHQPDAVADLERAVDSAGKKQFVLADDVLLLGVLVLMGYLAVANRGKASETEIVTREVAPDGKIKIITERKVIYFSPFSPLGQLVEKFWPTSGDG